MNTYLEYIKSKFSDKDLSRGDLEMYRSDFLSHIQFMQHERLIHLLIMMLFAMLLMFGFVIMLIYFSWVMVVFVGIIAAVEIFYIFHYYKLENGIQKMYRVYDELTK